MTDLQMMIMADRLLRVCGELQTMCKELMEADPVQPFKSTGDNFVPEFIRKETDDDTPVAKPPQCIHGLLFTEQCLDCEQTPR